MKYIFPGLSDPAILEATPGNISARSHTLRWTAESLSPIDSFEVQLKSDESEEWKSFITKPLNLNENTTNIFRGELILSKLTHNTTYMFTISSRNGFGFDNPEQTFSFTTDELEGDCLKTLAIGVKI